MKALRLVEDVLWYKKNKLLVYLRYIMLTRKEQELFHELMEANGVKLL